MHNYKLYQNIAAGVLLLLFTGTAMAQKPLVTAEKKAVLDQLSASIENEYNAGLKRALALAPQKNWIVRQKSKNGDIISLQKVSSLGFPLYYKNFNNTIAAATTRTNTVQTGGILGLNLSGSSTFLNGKLAIWDGGSVRTGHQEFAGKTITLRNATTAIDDHATHVAGTMIAKGVYAPAKGMSFNANTLLSYDFDNDVSEITAAAPNLLLSNHSYGLVAGWNYNSDQSRWEWYGLPGANEDYKFGYYDNDARDLDQVAVNAPYYLIVAAAGNARGYPGPAVGSTYFGYDASGTLVSKTRDASISSNTGYDVIPGFSTAKNLLTVGSINQLPYGPVSRTATAISYFSSLGPTDDGRVKPDICGDGDGLLSTGAASNTAYITESGTSMATPNVTGSLYLLQEYYAQKNSGNFMRSATLKALVCQTAFDAGNTGPDYTYGWGVLDMQKAAQAITDKGGKSLLNENTLAQGQTQTTTVIASGNGTLVATIAWTDPQGAVSANGTLNDRTPKLVNDLDIRISDGTTTYSPWVLNFAAPDAAATRGDNVRDNVEQVYIDNVIPGRTYTITVTHKGTLRNGPQAYSMVVTGAGGAAYCASAPLSSADSRINNFTLAGINNTPAAGCTTYSDYTNLTARLEQGSSYPLSITLGTCGGNFDKSVKVFIDWNGDGTFDPVTELAASSSAPINATGIFTASIAVPGNIVADNFTRMRVVVAETANASVITPCGSYAKGETQDYRVQFLKTSRDAGAISVTNSTVGGGCAGNSNVVVRLKNYGTASISNFPVRVTITPTNGGATTTITETYTGTLTPQAEDDFTLNGTFTSQAGLSYTLTAATQLTGDVVTNNDQATATETIGTTPVPTNLVARYCDDTKRYLLTGSGTGQLLWYTTPTGGTAVATGESAFTTATPVNNTFYAGLNAYSANVGPATKSVFSAGSYSQFAQRVYVTTKIPVVLQSARLYIGNGGTITVIATKASGEEVARSTINVSATRTVPAAGAQNDDLNDQGRVYNLNLSLPTAGDYILNVVYGNGATLFRNNGGVSGYPFGDGTFSITGNNATVASGDPDAYRNFYYFFYDMKVASGGCASTTRVPVQVLTPVITQNGTTLLSNFTANNQWYLNGTAIAGATAQTYVPEKSGNYQLQNLLTTGCTAISPVYTYIRSDAVSNGPADIKMSVFPVPATTELNLTMVATTTGDVNITLINSVGKIVYTKVDAATQGGNFSSTFGVSSMPAGTYILRLITGQKAYSTKVIIVH